MKNIDLLEANAGKKSRLTHVVQKILFDFRATPSVGGAILFQKCVNLDFFPAFASRQLSPSKTTKLIFWKVLEYTDSSHMKLLRENTHTI